MRIKIINGPNLNMLGQRESLFYGNFTLADLEKELLAAKKNSTDLTFFQSNSEADLIAEIHKSKTEKIEAIIINAAAFTHTSIALRDALLSVAIDFIEVHISNVYAREEFRQKSYLADKAIGVISGLGKFSYMAALNYFENR